MQAVICKSAHDPDCSDLLAELRDKGINYHFIDSLQQLPSALPKLDQTKPFLIYTNSQIRIDHPDLILSWHASHPEFDCVGYADDEDKPLGISFMPDKATVFRDTVVSRRAVRDEGTYPYVLRSYQDIPLKVRTKRPDCKPPAIFVLAHMRADYLKLSLNSLLYSIDRSVPVYIFLNGEHHATRHVAMEFAYQHPNVDCIQIPTNIHHSAVNLAIQWANPESFIIWEDDFILPPITKTLFPNWPYLFVDRLKHFDLVGWAPITENIPDWRDKLGNMFPRKDYAYYEWYESGSERYDPWIESTQKPLLLGQAVAMTREFWNRTEKRSPWYVPLDTELHSAAKTYCVPGLRGYHIGWNYKMDGYKTTNASTPELKHTIRSLKTAREQTFDLRTIVP